MTGANSSSPDSIDQPHMFLADIMLGSLARWLRILGFDTCYENCIEDNEIVRRAHEEFRIILTRDRRLAARREVSRFILIETDRLSDQLRQVMDELGLKMNPKRIFVRCVECNALLRPLRREEARQSVPPYVYRTQERFRMCPSCGRVYWRGTHHRRMINRLTQLLDS